MNLEDKITDLLMHMTIGSGILTVMIGALAILDGQITLGGWLGAIFGV